MIFFRRNGYAATGQRAGVDMPINRYLTFQFSYIRHNDVFLTSVRSLVSA